MLDLLLFFFFFPWDILKEMVVRKSSFVLNRIQFFFFFLKIECVKVDGFSDGIPDPEPTKKFQHRPVMTEFVLGLVMVFFVCPPLGRNFILEGVGNHPYS